MTLNPVVMEGDSVNAVKTRQEKRMISPESATIVEKRNISPLIRTVQQKE